MNHRPTSFLLRDKITFSEQETRKLRQIQKLKKLQKHHHDSLPPEFNYGTDETQTEIIPDIEPEIIPDRQTPIVIPPQLLTPDLPIKLRDLTSNPTNGGVHVDLTDLTPIRRKTKGAPIDTRNVDSMMDDASEILAALGL